MSRTDFSAQRLLVSGSLTEGAILRLSADQSHYLAGVLRLNAGDGLLVFNGQDGEWRSEIVDIAKKAVTLRCVSQTRPQTRPGAIWYAFAPLKSARLDYLVQKAVEMGASRLVPVTTRRTIVSRLNVDRMGANIAEAAEQCGVIAVPALAAEQTLGAFLATLEPERTLIFCDEDAEVASPIAALAAIPHGDPCALLVGPEGGFDPGERAMLLARPGVIRLSLGPRVLRADTAAVAALALVQAVCGDGG